MITLRRHVSAARETRLLTITTTPITITTTINDGDASHEENLENVLSLRLKKVKNNKETLKLKSVQAEFHWRQLDLFFRIKLININKVNMSVKWNWFRLVCDVTSSLHLVCWLSADLTSANNKDALSAPICSFAHRERPVQPVCCNVRTSPVSPSDNGAVGNFIRVLMISAPC